MCFITRNQHDNFLIHVGGNVWQLAVLDAEGFPGVISVSPVIGQPPTFNYQSGSPCGGGPLIFGTAPIAWNGEPFYSSGFITVDDAGANTSGDAQIEIVT